MKTKIIVSFLLFSLLTIACHKKSAPPSANLGEKAMEVTVDASADMSATGAAYSVENILIKGDVLSVFISHSGGCKDHTFELISNGMYAKSMPPQLSLCLKHTNNEDMCKKLILKELKFNISKIKYQGSKSLLVKLGDKSVNYEY
ncbi:MAG: hypothetical protein IPP64_01355 [Bacteroidetes bacterium]|nr:hypothetical protein [Bacteroidota bacterium]